MSKAKWYAKPVYLVVAAALVLSMGLVALPMAGTVGANGATWYVDDDNCPGPGSGTLAEPYCSIQDAIDAASAGDTIMVAAGTYKVADESWDGKRCIYIDKNLTLRGAGSGLTVLDAEHTYTVLSGEGPCGPHCTVVWNEAQQVTIEGITVMGGDYGIRNTTIDVGGGALTSLTLTDVVVDDNYGLGIVFENDIGTATLTNCEAKNSGDIGIYFTPNCCADTVFLVNTSANGNGHVGFSCQGSIADLDISGGTFNDNTGGMFQCDCDTQLGPYYGFGIELRNCVGTLAGVTAQGNGFDGPHITEGGADYAGGGAGIVVKHTPGFPASDILIAGANLQGNMSGLWIEDPDSVENWGACNGGVGSVQILFSNIIGNQEFGVLNCCTDDVDATNNWWGDNSGPSGAGPGTGDAVSDYVDYDPWLGAELEEVESEAISGSGTVQDTATGGDITIAATGNHTITVAKYGSNPGGSAPFSSEGSYYDIHLDDATNVTSLTVQFCPAHENESICYWDGSSWVVCSDQVYSDGCIVVTITDDTQPSLSDLTGLPFGKGFIIPVGGAAYPVSKASLFMPWIVLAVLLAGGASWYVLKRWVAQS